MNPEDEEISGAVMEIMAARPTFSSGDRVRVTAGAAECRRDWGNYEPPGHPDELIGMAGTVETPPPHILERGVELDHPVGVRLDGPCYTLGVAHWGVMLAPTELEHIPPS